MTVRQCPGCNFTYVVESKEDQLEHRRRHNRIVGMKRQAYNPKPLKSFLKLLAMESRRIIPEHVGSYSPPWQHRQMYLRARAFKKEFGYDVIQWEDHRESDINAHGFLLHEEGIILGACAFRWRRDHWAMQWIWLCPQARHKGLLTKWWPLFIMWFGNFDVEQPLSDAMAAFVKKVGHVHDNIHLGTVMPTGYIASRGPSLPMY